MLQHRILRTLYGGAEPHLQEWTGGFLQKMTIKLQPHDEQEVSWEEEGEECFGQKVQNVRR